jgi:hypothetical protein
VIRDSIGFVPQQVLPILKTNACRPQTSTKGMTKIVNSALAQICAFTCFAPRISIDAENRFAFKSKDKFFMLSRVGPQ